MVKDCINDDIMHKSTFIVIQNFIKNESSRYDAKHVVYNLKPEMNSTH